MILYRPPRSAPGAKRPWSIAPDEESQPVEAGLDPDCEYARPDVLPGNPPLPASRVSPSTSCAAIVSTAEPGSGVRQAGHRPLASTDSIAVAQVGQEMVLVTLWGSNYMTSRLLYFPERFAHDPVGDPQPRAVPAA